MHLLRLSCEYLRSYDQLLLEPSNGCSVLIGENGSGKTNIIEAISLLSQTRSCLRARPEDMVRWGQIFLRVRGMVRSDAGEETSLEYVFQTSPTRQSAFFLQDRSVSLLEFIGFLPSMIFLPESLDLFTGPPRGRRSFLESLLTQLQPSYAARRMAYERVLKQRNALLRSVAMGTAQPEALDPWDREFAVSAYGILVERMNFVRRLSESLSAEVQTLGERWSSTVLEYLPTLTGTTIEEFIEQLRMHRQKELLNEGTILGPHRDDWQILADGHEISSFASRGQQRTVLLALLFIAVRLFTSVRKERPVILLDDVLSELDQRHQCALFSVLKDHQVFLTTTSLPEGLRDIRIFDVSGGGVTRRIDA